MRERVIVTARLGLLFLAIALATSRFTLVLHELVGHGGMVVAVGGTVDDVHLYWFAGGFIEFSRAAPYTVAEELGIFLGGIGLEVVLGLCALLAVRATDRGSMARIVLLSFAVIVLVHAGYYLSAGTYHGFGDGQVLHRRLGAARLYLVIPLAVIAVATAHILSRHLVARVRARIAGPGDVGAVWCVGIATLLAAGGHAALSFGELALRPSPTYRVTMRHESERLTERELAIYARAIAAERGREPDAGELAARQRELDRQNAGLPFGRVLLVLFVVALLSGAARSASLVGGAAASAPLPRSLPWRDLTLPAGLALAGLALVVILSVVV